MPAFDRTPPQHLDAEVAVLGSALLSRPALAEIVEIVRPEDFYRSAHRTIYETILDLFARGEVIDPITIVDKLANTGKLEQIGGASAIHDLMAEVPTAANAVYYARIVHEKAVLRRLIEAGTEVVQLGYDGGDDVSITIDRAEQLIYDVAQGRVSSEYSSLKELLSEGFERIEQRFENRSEVTGLATGFNDLDRLTAGLQPQNLIIVAARPSMGKCLAESSRVIDGKTGAVRAVGDVVATAKEGRPVHTLSLGAHARLHPTEPDDFLDNGVRTVFKLRTRLGRETRVTANHPFLTPKGWRRLDELAVGELVALPRKIDVFGTEELPDAEVALLGYFLGDGCIVKSRATPAVTSKSPHVATDLRRWATTFATEVTETRHQSTEVRTYRFRSTSHRATQSMVAEHLGLSVQHVGAALRGEYGVSDIVRSRVAEAADYLGYTGHPRPNAVTAMLERHGLRGRGSHDKFVPDAVFRLRKHQIALFLSRLFACDGSAWTSGNYYGVSYASVSHRLILDVQHLLLRFGINAYVRERQVKYRDTRRRAYELEIRDPDQIRTFMREIGIFSKEEQCREVLAALKPASRHTKVDLLPLETWDVILEEKGGRSWAEVSQATGRPRNHNWHVHRRQPSRWLVREIADAIGSKRLREIADSDLVWDEVVAIEPDGRERVYDLTIPQVHNFVADDFIVHNSSLALGMAQYVTVELDKPAVMFSLEMSKAEIVDRVLSSEARIDSFKIRNGRLDDADWASLSDAMGRLAEAPLFIDDTPSITLMEIRAKCRRLKQRVGLELVIVDYLQLMQSHKRTENRQQEVSDISRGMKMLAKELDIPVIALSQLSRQPENRTDKRPQLADLRESGSIEQDADVVGFIYRDEVYDPDTPDRGVAELIISKHRNGPTGVVKLAFLDHLTKFANLARSQV